MKHIILYKNTKCFKMKQKIDRILLKPVKVFSKIDIQQINNRWIKNYVFKNETYKRGK